MIDSRLLKLLRSLEDKSLEDFEKYLHSPLHNTNTTFQDFYAKIKPYAPSFTDPALDKANLYVQIYDEAPPPIKDCYRKLRALASNICAELEKFLAIQQFLQQQYTPTTTLLRSHSERGNVEEFGKVADRLEDNLKQSIKPQVDQTLLLHQHYLLLFCHPELLSQTNYTSIFPLLQQSASHLARYQEWFKLWYQIESINSKDIHDDVPTGSFIDSNLHAIDLEWLKRTLTFLQQPIDFTQFTPLWNDFLIAAPQLCWLNQLIIYSKLLSCSLHPPEPFVANPQQIFDIYRAGIEYGFFGQNGSIYFPHFISTITTAAMSGNIKWAEQFVQQHGDYITPRPVRADAIELANAYLHFYKKDFAAAELILNQRATQPHAGLELIAKGLHLRVLYENWQIHSTFIALDSEYSWLKSNARAFSIFLKRQQKRKEKAPQKQIARAFTLIDRVKKLSKLKMQAVQYGKHTKKYQRLLDNLQMDMREHPIVLDNWVRAKVNQL